MCEHEEVKNYTIPRIILAIILFICAYIYKPLFLVAYVLIGFDILFRAIKNIIKGQIFDENFLMSLATLGAICIKEYPEAAMVMILYQIGEYMQDKAVDKSRDEISKLMNIRPDYANLNGEKVNPDIVKIGDIITVKTGEKIPLDGIITKGQATIDTSALTGESMPRKAKEGDEIISGSVNLDGLLEVKVTKLFGESTVSKILELVENASSKKAKTENFITKFARYYTPAVVIIAIFMALIPPFYIKRALTFLVISCPCALVISIPLTFFAGIGSASKNGVLIKGSSYLEILSKIKTVVFDKTGTLTKGNFNVVEINSSNEDLLKYAASAESASSHPIANAIKSAYHGEMLAVDNIQEIAGQGIKAMINGKKVLVGNSKLVNTKSIESYGTVVYVSIDDRLEGHIVIADEIKNDAKSTINLLKRMGISTVMLTGDSTTTAKNVSDKLGIDKFRAELLPVDKVKELENIIKENIGNVAFVGDGINDAPVLTRADIGIAMGGLGSDAAIEAADVVIMDDMPYKVVNAIKIAKKTMAIVKENIIFALGIKFAFLIFGALGFVSMWGAVFADVGVSLIAILNALRAMSWKQK